MRMSVDLNVILDVVQEREWGYLSSAAVLQLVVGGKVTAVIPGHLLATLYFITNKHSSKEQADMLVDWILKHFDIGNERKETFMRARILQFSDFEDALVASVAESEECSCIVSRNIKDFRDSPIPALTPEEFLVQLEHE